MRFRAIALGVALAMGLVMTPAAATSAHRYKTVLTLSRHGDAISHKFTVSSPWHIIWRYHCTSADGGKGPFEVNIYKPNGDDSQSDYGPAKFGKHGHGVKIEHDGGKYYFKVISTCSWTIKIKARHGREGARPSSKATNKSTHTIIDRKGSDTGQTRRFHVKDGWHLVWEFNCNAYGSRGNFIVNVYQSNGDPNYYDSGPNKLAWSGTGDTREPRGGHLYLKVISECHWRVSVVGKS